MLTVRRSTLWLGAALASAAAAAGYRAAGLSLAPAGGIYLVLLAVMATVAAARPRLVTERERRLADVIELSGLFCWIGLVGALASYAVAAGSTGYRDDLLARADAALGFDWLAAYRFVAARPWLSDLAGAAYRSIFLTPLVVVAALAWTGRAEQATRFIALFALALAVALVSFHFWPARSALAHYVGLTGGYLPATGIDHVAQIEGLRRGTITAVDPTRIVGMITFPSFHAVCAILFTWGGWSVRRLRVPLLAVNGAMLAVTPVEGTHYLVDVIAGVLLAGALIAAAGGRGRAVPRPAGSPVAA